MPSIHPSTLFRRAEQAFLSGDNAAALTDLDALTRQVGPQPTVLHLTALIHKRLGARQQAHQAFQSALHLSPDDAQIANNLANLLDEMGDHDAALAHFGKAIATNPRFPDARINRGLLLHRLGRTIEALADLDAASILLPNARVATARGNILRDLGRLDDAAVAFDIALHLEPMRLLALSGRARVSLERGEFDAADRYRAALTVKPGNAELELGLALAVEAEGGTSAVPMLARTLEQHPSWAEGHEQLARMRSESGDHADIARSYLAALPLLPDDHALHRSYWRTLIRAERYDDALAAINAAPRSLRMLPDTLTTEAMCASEAGDCDRADALLGRLSDYGDVALVKARHALRCHDPDRAADLLENYLDRAPDDVVGWAHLCLAWRLTDDARIDWLIGQRGLFDTVDLDIDIVELETLATALRGLHRTRAYPIGQSLRGGTQTRGRLLIRAEPPLVRLRTLLERAVSRHLAKLPPRDDKHPLLRHRDQRMTLAGSWSVRLEASGFHVNHVHPLGVLSSAFYIALPDCLGKPDTRDGWLDLGAPPVEFGLTLPPLASIEPRPGRLVLFPSYLFHGTRPFTSGERLTVAFDVITAPH